MHRRLLTYAASIAALLATTGFSLLAYANADTPPAQPAGLVDWATVAMGMGSVIIMLLGGILVHVNTQITRLSDQLWKRVVEAEQQIESLHKTLLREYHTKDDLREMLNITLRPLMEKLTRLGGDMDAVYRELLRTSKRKGDSDEHS